MPGYESPKFTDTYLDIEEEPLRIPLTAEMRNKMEEAISQGAGLSFMVDYFGVQAVEAFYTDPNAPQPMGGKDSAA